MIEHIHRHITEELQQNTRTDIIFILASIVLNLIILAVNSGMSNNSKTDDTYLIVMLLFVALLILINLVVIYGLIKGKNTRSLLLDGLIKMYHDEKVDKYYNTQLLANYNTRYNLFMMVVVLTGIVAIVVPFVIR